MKTCDCLYIPIPKRCEKFCLEKILRAATLDEKLFILGIKEKLALKIKRLYNQLNIQSFNDLNTGLTVEEKRTLIRQLRNLTQSQLDHFKNKIK